MASRVNGGGFSIGKTDRGLVDAYENFHWENKNSELSAGAMVLLTPNRFTGSEEQTALLVLEMHFLGKQGG